MISEKFSNGSSWAHQLDPRVKFILTIFFVFTIALGNQILMLGQGLIFAIILVITTSLNYKDIIKRLLVVNIFIALIWVFIPFTYKGKVIFNIWYFSASLEGLIYALKITLRANTIMLIIITFLSTSTISNLLHALNYFYLPNKLIYLFFFVYRYLHVIKDEFDTLYNAMLIRGFKSETSLHTYKSYAYLIAVLLIRSYERSQKVYEAMLCRGFKGEFYIIDDFNINKRDYIFIFIFSIVIIYLNTLEILIL